MQETGASVTSLSSAAAAPSDAPALEDILAAYIQAVEAGASPSREELLTCYPRFADDLRHFFADRDRIKPLSELKLFRRSTASLPDDTASRQTISEHHSGSS
jgi:hypothetical protein